MQLPDDLNLTLRSALIKALPLPGELGLAVRDANLRDPAGDIQITFDMFQQPGVILPVAIDNLLAWIAANDYVCQFLDTPKIRNSRNPQLQQVLARLTGLRKRVEALGGNPQEVPLGRLEKLVFRGFAFADAEQWLTGLGRLKRGVCRIEPQPATADPSSLAGYGTGFLIAPDVLLTNAHVTEPFFRDRDRAGRVRCRFGFEKQADGQLSMGVEHALHPVEWGVLQGKSGALDFGLLRLATPAGNDVVAGEPRGWFPLARRDCLPDEGLVILQHPQGTPLKLALGPVEEPDSGPVSVSYRVNTEPGSSGAPCLTQQLEVAAIHYRGDTAEPLNHGVRIGKVLERLGQTTGDDRARVVAAGLSNLLT